MCLAVSPKPTWRVNFVLGTHEEHSIVWTVAFATRSTELLVVTIWFEIANFAVKFEDEG